ncbi:MAG: hypothetical protein WBA93_32360 [Microcoleaceae cyanobacterium]
MSIVYLRLNSMQLHINLVLHDLVLKKDLAMKKLLSPPNFPTYSTP